MVAMRILPRQAVTNIRFVRKMRAEILGLVEKARTGFPEIHTVSLGGSLRNRLDEYEIVIQDVKQSGQSAGILILLALLVYFRNLRKALLVLGSALVGLVWTAAIINQTLGFLNILSATVFVVLLGLGLDHGIHLLRRYRRARDAGSAPLDATVVTMGSTGRAVVVSALTTAVGFALLLFTGFRGFSHLGAIAALATILVPVVYFAIFPAVFALGGDKRWDLPWKTGGTASRKTSKTVVYLSPGKTTVRPMPWVLPVLVTLALGGAAAGFGLHYNDDFRTLMGKPAAGELLRQKCRKYTMIRKPLEQCILPRTKRH